MISPEDEAAARQRLDVEGLTQRERAKRIVLAILSQEPALGEWVFEDLQNDPRGDKTATYALIYRLAIDHATLSAEKWGSEEAAAENLRDEIARLYADGGK